MWCPCPCTHHCDDNLKCSPLISHEMGSFPVLHGLLSLSSGNMVGGGGGGGGYPGSMMGLQRSATCGYLPSHHFYPMKDDFNDQATIINGRLTITDGKLDDDDDVMKAKMTAHSKKHGESKHHDEGGKKTRDYSDDCLTPDSTLPAVIRRRNRNRRKKLAVSTVVTENCLNLVMSNGRIRCRNAKTASSVLLIQGFHLKLVLRRSGARDLSKCVPESAVGRLGAGVASLT